jgi:uncharacterized ion transporter superfamily protein YfcC
VIDDGFVGRVGDYGSAHIRRFTGGAAALNVDMIAGMARAITVIVLTSWIVACLVLPEMCRSDLVGMLHRTASMVVMAMVRGRRRREVDDDGERALRGA